MVMREGAARMVVGVVLASALAVGCKTKTAAPSAAAAATAQSTAAPSPPAGLPAAKPASAPAAPAAGGDDPCPAICERTKPLKCKRTAACRDTCRDMRRVEQCGTEMAAVLSCFARQPQSAWECSDEGDAALKDGFCDEQQGRFASCLQRTAAAPPARI
jgi:hypothetical protein